MFNPFKKKIELVSAGNEYAIKIGSDKFVDLVNFPYIWTHGNSQEGYKNCWTQDKAAADKFLEKAKLVWG